MQTLGHNQCLLVLAFSRVDVDLAAAVRLSFNHTLDRIIMRYTLVN